MKDQKGTTITNVFQKVVKNSKRKRKTMWIVQGSEFYNNRVKKWLNPNNIEMYSAYKEEKSVVAERFIRTLKDKIYKHIIAVF